MTKRVWMNTWNCIKNSNKNNVKILNYLQLIPELYKTSNFYFKIFDPVSTIIINNEKMN